MAFFFVVLTDIDMNTQDNTGHWVSLPLYVIEVQLRNVQRLSISSCTICNILEQVQKPFSWNLK